MTAIRWENPGEATETRLVDKIKPIVAGALTASFTREDWLRLAFEALDQAADGTKDRAVLRATDQVGELLLDAAEGRLVALSAATMAVIESGAAIVTVKGAGVDDDSKLARDTAEQLASRFGGRWSKTEPWESLSGCWVAKWTVRA